MNLAWMRLLQMLREADAGGAQAGGLNGSLGQHADDDDDDDDDPDVPGDAAKQLKEWQRYAKRLRTKEAQKRVENKDLKAKLAALEAEKAKLIKDHEAALEAVRNEEKVKYEALIAETKKQADARAVESELRAQAVKAGAKDVDDLLKLIDKSTTTIDDKGNVVGADKAIEEFKKAKPHLFGNASQSTTSSAEAPPPNNPGAAKKATEMTAEEYAAARAKLLGTPLIRR